MRIYAGRLRLRKEKESLSLAQSIRTRKKGIKERNHLAPDYVRGKKSYCRIKGTQSWGEDQVRIKKRVTPLRKEEDHEVVIRREKVGYRKRGVKGETDFKGGKKSPVFQAGWKKKQRGGVFMRKHSGTDWMQPRRATPVMKKN